MLWFRVKKGLLVKPNSKWQVLLAEYDIVYITRKAIKGSAIADHLANNIVEDYEPPKFAILNEDVLVVEDDDGINDWCTMYFDGVMNVSENRIRVVIISYKGSNILF